MASGSIVLMTSVVVFLLMTGLTASIKRSYESSDIYQLDDDCDDCVADDGIDDVEETIDPYEDIFGIAKREDKENVVPCTIAKPKRTRKRQKKRRKSRRRNKKIRVSRPKIVTTEQPQEEDTEKPEKLDVVTEKPEIAVEKVVPAPMVTKAKQSLQDLIDELESGTVKPEVEERLVSKADCRSPWIWICPGYCFQIIKQKYTVHWARTTCQRQGGHLLTVNSEDKAQAVQKLAKAQFKSFGDYWMSSIGISEDGEAVWRSTGEPLAYTNFARRVYSDKPCMSLLRGIRKWKEVNVCRSQFLKAICEKASVDAKNSRLAAGPDEVDATKKPPVTTEKPDVTEKPEPVVEKEVSVTVVTKTKPTKPKAKMSLQDLIEELEGQTDRPEREDKLVSQADCRAPWSWISPGYCFYIIKQKINENWAERTCQRQGGHLLTVNSEEKAKAVQKLDKAQFKSSGDYWMSSIGISKDGEAVWRSTGEPLAYTNFAQRVNGDTPCMSLLRDNGKWKEVNVCHFQFLKAICDKDEVDVTKKPLVTTEEPDVTEKQEPVVEKEVSVTVVTKTKPTKPKAKMSLQDLIEELEGQTDKPEREDKLVTQADCRAPWSWISPGYCFYIIKQKINENWAERTCQRQGGHLLTVNSEDKAKAVQKLDKAQFKSSGDYWMSSIGISKDGEAVRRSTGEPLAYTNFAQSVKGDRPCMSLLRDNRKWKEVNVCHFQFLKAICDKGTSIGVEKMTKSI